MVLLCLIALAIPMQGMAAVAMAMCAPSHRAVMAGAPERLAEAPSMRSHADGAHSHRMPHAAQSAFDGGTSVAPHDAAPDGQAGHAGHGTVKCCSATCTMVALTSLTLVASAKVEASLPLHPVAQIYQGVTPDGLERPPKLFLA